MGQKPSATAALAASAVERWVIESCCVIAEESYPVALSQRSSKRLNMIPQTPI